MILIVSFDSENLSIFSYKIFSRSEIGQSVVFEIQDNFPEFPLY